MQRNSGGIRTWSGPLFGYRHPQSTQIVTRHLLSPCAQEDWLQEISFPAATEALRQFRAMLLDMIKENNVYYYWVINNLINTWLLMIYRKMRCEIDYEINL